MIVLSKSKLSFLCFMFTLQRSLSYYEINWTIVTFVEIVETMEDLQP